MASTSESAASTSGNHPMTTRNRENPMLGFLYQIKLLMLFVLRGLRAGHIFRVATEIESTKKFDDVVYEYTEDKRKIYRLLHVKHRYKIWDKITKDRLLNQPNSGFNLIEYFFAYREIKDEKQFKRGKIEDVIVFTNIDFDHEDLARNNIALEIIGKKDTILSMSRNPNLSRTPLLYRFGPDTISNFMKNVENYELTKVARQLVKCLLSCEVIEHHQEPFMSYHMILAKEVINTHTNNFQGNFLAERLPEDENRPLENITLRFRTIFKEVFEKETDYKIKFADLNKAIDEGRKINSKKIDLKFSKNFGKKTEEDSFENTLPGEEGWPTNAFSSEDIKNFFDHLVFAVNQPNNDELGSIIRKDMENEFGIDSIERFYEKFQDMMLRLIQGKENKVFSTSSEWKKFFDAEKQKLGIKDFDTKDFGTNYQAKMLQTFENQQKVRIGKHAIHSFMYQTKLLMLFVHRGIRAGHTFRLAADTEFAKKFNDVVYEYTEDGSKIYRLLHAKHKLNVSGNDTITKNSLLSQRYSGFDLVTYFFAYRKIKDEKQFKGAKIQDVIVFTNIDFDHEDLARHNIKLEVIEKKDIILGMSSDHNLSRTPLLYRFSPDTISNFMKNVENYELTKLARQLVKCLLSSEVIKHHQEPFKSYHMILAKEVIDIHTKKFQSNFLAGYLSDDKNCPLEESTLRFRTVFQEVFEKETRFSIKVADLNKAIDEGREIKSKKIGLQFSKKFGKKAAKKTKKDSSENALPEEEAWPKNAISSEDIKDFLDHLVFAVNQPNEDELGNIIRRELGEGFDEDWTENVYSKFKSKIMTFIQSTEENWLSSSEWRKFFGAEKEKRQTIFFDIQDPVGLFTGRKEQLNNLHKILLKSNSRAISQITAISGLGGIGKSELVRKYISLHKSDFDNRVIWLNAESHAALSDSFKRLASEKLKISWNNFDGSSKNIQSLVEDVYTYFSAAKSLFIFNNTDENLGLNDITEFLPGSFLCHKPYVVITSRNREWGPITVLYLDVLTNSEAMELIKKALNINSDAQDNEICMLAETLQFFPLALQQALAYINVRDAELKKIGKKFGIGDYLNRFEKDPKQLIDFRLSNEAAYTNTTFTTWNTTIEKISSYSKIGEIAVDILNMMAFLGPDDIPASMFLPLCDNEETIGSAVQLLKKFSIVSSGQDPRLLNIHRLVQLVARLNLSVWKNVVQDQDGEESSLLEVCRLSLCYVSEIEKENQHFLRHKFVVHLQKLLSNLDEWCSEKNRDMIIELNSIISLLSTMGEEYNAIGSYHKKQKLQEFDSNWVSLRKLRHCKKWHWKLKKNTTGLSVHRWQNRGLSKPQKKSFKLIALEL